ncbi:MAG: hypothetical protein KIT81_15055 [Alphaproteobacteria bacterium]|nr:hypothetical protein [Alphaproteobacteria bacterium]
MPLDNKSLEDLFGRLAGALEALDERDRPVFLAKLTLLLAAEIGDRARIEALIVQALRHLGPDHDGPGSGAR